MTDAFAAALFTALPATIASIATLVVGIRNTRQIAEVRHQTNTMKDELITSTRIASRTVGQQEGAAEERIRHVEAERQRRLSRPLTDEEIVDVLTEHSKLDDIRFTSLEKRFDSIEHRFDAIDRQLQRIAGSEGAP